MRLTGMWDGAAVLAYEDETGIYELPRELHARTVWTKSGAPHGRRKANREFFEWLAAKRNVPRETQSAA